MADDRSGSWSIPGPLLAVLLLAGGAMFLVPPLVSSRPQTDVGPSPQALGAQDVSARAWQDPFKAAFEHREAVRSRVRRGELDLTPVRPPAAPPPATGPSPAPEGTDARVEVSVPVRWRDPADAEERTHHPDRLRDEISAGTGDAQRVLILAVMIEGEPYPELAEQRLRARHAVLSGLGTAGFVSADSGHIGYVELPWPGESEGPEAPADPLKDLEQRASGAGGAPLPRLLIPYEWCEPTHIEAAVAPGASGKPGTANARAWKRVLVLWLREEAFADRPLDRLAFLLNKLTPNDGGSAERCDVRLVGPRTSTTLDEFYAGTSDPDGRVRRRLGGVLAFSPTASASPDVLLHRPPAAGSTLPSGDGGPGTCFKPLRVMLSDDQIATALINELARRGIELRPPATPAAGAPERDEKAAAEDKRKPHVALVAEWDTFYGRALPYTFAAAASGQYTAKEMMADPAKVPAYIHRFIYQRGIDGRIAGAGAAPATAAESGGGTGGGARAGSGPFTSYAETPEGTNQSDYIRRLAQELSQIDRRLFRERGEGLRAVGVLGSDLYDTLLTLRALRGLLPHAVFFTTTLDARLGHPSEWEAAHNLVVVTGYGLSLHPYYQRNVPPFRDTNQTATFAATLAACGMLGGRPDDLTPLLGAPRIFEIGRRGPHDLSVDLDAFAARQVPLTMTLEAAYPNGPGTVHPYRAELAGWWTARRATWFAILLVAAALGMGAFLLFVLKFDIRALRPGLLLSHPLPFFIIALGVVVAALWRLYWAQVVEGEPFALVGGISVWPTIAARVLVGAACIHFIARNRRLTEGNDRKIESTFLDPPDPAAVGPVVSPARAFRDVAAEMWNRHWKVTIVDKEGEKEGESRVDAALLWKEYIRHSGQLYRVIRAVAMSVAFLVFIGCLMVILGTPTSPARGDLSRWLDWLATYFWAVPLGTLLTFFAIDATMINRYFIKHLTKLGTHWPPHAYKQCARRGLDDADLNDYLDIRLIAMRTEVVGRLVYTPLLVVFVLIVSHASYFDNWNWPQGTVAAYVVSIGCSVVSALVLRRAAEQARANALERMRDLWICYLGNNQPKAKALEELIGEVKSERRGAFSILSQYPFLAALLLPSGGFGVWVLIEYLATNSFF